MDDNRNKAKVETHLAHLECAAPGNYGIVQTIRQIIRDIFPGIHEKVMYGGVVFFLNEDMVAGVFSRTHHVSLEFGHGHMMEDPGEWLEGKGKYRRHLKIGAPEDIESKEVASYVRQIPLV